MANQIIIQDLAMVILVEAHYINSKEEDQIISRVMVAQIKTHQKDKNGTKSCKNGVQNALENI